MVAASRRSVFTILGIGTRTTVRYIGTHWGVALGTTLLSQGFPGSRAT
jgi:hypothetical protein